MPISIFAPVTFTCTQCENSVIESRDLDLYTLNSSLSFDVGFGTDHWESVEKDISVGLLIEEPPLPAKWDHSLVAGAILCPKCLKKNASLASK